MPRFTNWKKLEEKMKDYLKNDNAKTTPGSGNSKKEEDVVGMSTICQCKDSESKNVNILAKDIDRLLNAAKILKKSPLFASRSGEHTLISVPIDDDNEDEVKFLLDFIIMNSSITILEELIKQCDDSASIAAINKEFTRIEKVANNLLNESKDKISNVRNILLAKITDTMTYNLFGEENAS